MQHSLFISDLHLSADHPDSMAAFSRFIASLAPDTEALYILGDLFEYWAGDDDLHDPFHLQVISELHHLSTHGTRVFLMHGNRDLLMGNILANACGAILLADPTLIDLYGTPTLLSHGDALCTDDLEYQHYRSQVRSPDFQQQFLTKPLAERKIYIENLRNKSKVEKQEKDSAIMDVSDVAVTDLLRRYHYPRLIHGHTHRPALHQHQIDGHQCERWVLGDWDCQADALYADTNGIKRLII